MASDSGEAHVVSNVPPADPDAANPARRLRHRYLFALALVAVLILAAAAVMRTPAAALEGDAPTLNLAGRQRMLSQRVAKDALTLRHAPELRARRQAVAELRESVEAWKNAHEALRFGDPARGIPAPQGAWLEAAFEDLQPDFQVIRDAALQLLARPEAVTAPDSAHLDLQVARILAHEPAYLERMDAIVSRYEQLALERVIRLERIGLLFLLASVLVLVVVGLAVLEPAVRLIRRQLRALRRSETRHRALTENANDLIIEIDQERRLLYVSPSHRDVLGLDSERFLGRDCAGFPHPEDRAVVTSELAQLFSTRTPVEFVTRLRHRNGSWRHVEARARCYETAEGEARAVVVARDVTERQRAEEFRRRLEEQLRETQKLESLGLLAGGVAHDFNNLLTAVLGNAQLAMLDLPDGAPARARLERVLAAGKRAAELTGQLFTYAGRGTPALRVLDLAKLVEEMADLLRVSISRKLSLELELAADLPCVEGDPTQLRQLVMNLILNASEAVGDRVGAVRLETGALSVDDAFREVAHLGETLAGGEHVYLRVSDDGPGMDEETRRRIFDPFYSTKFVGRGLGLAVVLGIVRSHRGAIHVASQAGCGTSFTVVFPPSAHEASSTPAPQPAQAVVTGGTVLVVDDERDVREVATLMLERLGYRVLTAQDGRDGVQVFRSRAHEIDAVLLDLTMPRMSGDEALAEMRCTRPDLPVVLMTGYDATFQGARARAATLAPYLRKPFSTDELGTALAEVLEGSEPQRSATE